MTNKSNKTRIKRSSQSWRKHIRRMKQEAGKTVITPRQPARALPQPRVAEQKD